jgi:xanthine dehydrogenase YagS FAD-binding subunit
MRSFQHISARTVEEACMLRAKYKGKAVLNAGGTDLLLTLKGDYLFDYPEIVVDVKTIPDLDYIREDNGLLKIGALRRLCDIAKDPLAKGCLGEAALSVASPQVRNSATIGGNLCQEVRCWYYRYPRHVGGPIECLRKGSGRCLAVTGDNRYHAIFGGRKCFAVCPSDCAVALAALDAQIAIQGPEGRRKLPVIDFYTPLRNALKSGEMVTEVQIPIPSNLEGARQKYLKFSLRKPLDFAIVSVASVIAMSRGVCMNARIFLGGVAPAPFQATEAQEFLKGQSIDEHVVTEAAKMALRGARPLSKNAFKVEIAKSLVRRAISC